MNWVKIGDAPEQGNYITKTAEKIRPEGLKKTREVHPGDLILSNSMSFGRPYIMAIDGCIHDGWLLIRDEEKRYDLKFLCQMLGTEQMLAQYRAMAAGSTVNNLNKELVGNTEVKVPSIAEQAKIGEYFSKVDNLITLHQRKTDKLKNLKKAMLEKMFPKKGTVSPEIRFNGFTNAWEQRKISDVSKITTGGTPNTKVSEYWNPGEIPWLSSGEVHKKYIAFTDNMISRTGMENSSARMVQENSVLIALAGQGKTRGTVAINRIPLTTNQSIAAMTFDNTMNPEFVFSNLEIRYDELRSISSGDGSRGGLNKQLIGNIIIPRPSLEEQIKIGEFFKDFNNFITLHQRKIDMLKKLKSACLSEMFI